MVKIQIPETEYWDPVKQEFRYGKAMVLSFEHSLISLSKWEAKHHKAFLTRENKTPAEMHDYIRCMCMNTGIEDDVFDRLTADDIKKITDNIEDPHTATVIKQMPGGHNHDVMTNEVIYYAMFANGIPKECEKWHLNRLITLINVFSVKNKPPKQMSKKAILRQNHSINAARLKKYNTKG